MGLLDGMLGGVLGGEMAATINSLVEKHGGLPGIIDHLRQQGLGDTVRSWVSTGDNLPVSGRQLQDAFGADTIRDLAGKIGMDPQILAHRLSQLLPQAIDKLTPGGVVPHN